MRRDWHGLREVRDHIEGIERMLAEGYSDKADVMAEIDEVLKRYKTAQGNMESNRPETYTIQGTKGMIWTPEQGIVWDPAKGVGTIGKTAVIAAPVGP